MSGAELATRPIQADYLQVLPQSQAEFRILDLHSENGVLEETRPRMDWIATISAGGKEEVKKRDGSGMTTRPFVSRDGMIHLHDPEGHAAGLAQALALNGNKMLTIAFPFDDKRLFIQQRFAEYSASALLAYGDENSITLIQNGQHIEHRHGTSGYRECLKRPGMKVTVSVFFYLAEWGEDGQPRVTFPDGLGLYRLRFTGHNSLRSIVASIDSIMLHTRGRIAGLPFDLFIDYREVARPDGTRTRVPVWQAIMRPPVAYSLTSQNFRTITERSLEQGAALMLTPPAPETMEMAALEPPAPDLDAAEVEVISNGGRCDAEHWRATWFAAVKGTRFENEDERHIFIYEHSGERTASLADFLSTATESEAQNLVNAVSDIIESEQIATAERESGFRLYEKLREVATRMELKLPSGKAWPSLPDSISTEKLQSYIATLKRDIAAAQEQAAESEAAESDPVVEAEVAAPTNEGGVTLYDAVHQNGEDAANPSPEEVQEADTIFGQGEEPLSESLLGLLSAAAEAGVDHGGDPMNEALLEKVNGYLPRIGLPLVNSITELDDTNATKIAAAFVNKKIK